MKVPKFNLPKILHFAKETFRWILLGAITITIAGVASFIYLYVRVELPEEPEQAESTVLYADQGEVIAELFDEENRTEVELEQITSLMREGTLASEDKDFYSHPGISVTGLARAAVSNASGRPIQGGSTITQQLVKNYYLSPERTIERKANEAILALKIERRYSKDQILEMYLNTVYFGRGAYGVEAGAKNYFGVKASELNAAQSAYLIAALKSPERTKNPEVILEQRNLVLKSMLEEQVVTQEAYDNAVGSATETLPESGSSRVKIAGTEFFVEMVREELRKTFSEQYIQTRGLKVYTTLSIKAQDLARDSVAGVLNEEGDPEAAVVSLDRSGYVKALYGGRDYNQSKVNLALGKEGGGVR